MNMDEPQKQRRAKRKQVTEFAVYDSIYIMIKYSQNKNCFYLYMWGKTTKKSEEKINPKFRVVSASKRS